MEQEGNWRLLMNEGKGKMSRLIFSNRRCLIDTIVQSQNAARVVHNVLANSWNRDQLMVFLRGESEQVVQEAL
ncbi:MAG: hypothetical protein P4N59_14910 [Negativicutes bacterium]|nr:hypothetical protein [Negativicutes bacterium]